MNNDEYKTLLLRNQISIRLDDLTAMIKSSSLSYEVRRFSNEVMETEPGFVFKYRQAQTLRRRTDEAYRQYERPQTRSDTEIMNFLSEGRAILKGEDIPNGGNRMSFFKNLFSSKDLKRQQGRDTIESTYNKVCQQIAECEAGMQRAIQNGTGHSKDSMVYRDSAREYSRCKNQLVLLHQQLEQLTAALKKLDDIDNVRLFNQTQETISEAQTRAMGNQKENERELAKAGLYMEKARQEAQYNGQFGQSLYEAADTNAIPQMDSEFDAAVAQNELRKIALEADPTAQQATLEDEFAKLTGQTDQQ